MTHWKSLGFGSKERKSCDFLERQNSSDMVRPEKKMNGHQHVIKISRRLIPFPTPHFGMFKSRNNEPLKTCRKWMQIRSYTYFAGRAN